MQRRCTFILLRRWSIRDGLGFLQLATFEKLMTEVSTEKNQEQWKTEDSYPFEQRNHLFQLVVEEESRQDIKGGVKERTESVHQQKAHGISVQGSGTQGHEYAYWQEFRSREHLDATND